MTASIPDVAPTDAAADQSDEQFTANEDGQNQPDDQESATDLGDAGKRTLDAIRAERNAARAAAQKAERQRKELQAELQELRNAEADRNRTDEERTKEQNRRDAETAATAKANQRLLRSEIRAAAAGKLADPHDALAHLDLSQFDVNDDGDVNEEQINAAIADLLERKPYLAPATVAQPGKKFPASDAGAARKGQEGPKQLTAADLESMSLEQVMAAQKAGQLTQLLSKKGA